MVLLLVERLNLTILPVDLTFNLRLMSSVLLDSTAGSIGITSIKAGDGVTSSDTITVTLSEGLSGLSVDTAIQINDIGVPGYNGKFTVSDVLAVDNQGTTQFKYNVSNAPANALPSTTGSTVSLEIDTVGSASPYIFNISLRSCLWYVWMPF